MIVFDIETGPLPFDQLAAMMPPFNEEDVAVGNLKDPVKIYEKVSKARESHEASFIERAALSACTGIVKAIGVGDDNECSLWIWGDGVEQGPPDLLDAAEDCFVLGFKDEANLIQSFWKYLEKLPGESIVGHNIHGFDLPFLIRRSWMLEIDVPRDVMNGRYFAPRFLDTMAVWSCGGRDFIKLDVIAKAMGVGCKSDDCTGADFARMFDAGGEERVTALKYLRNDLSITRRVAIAMQLL